MVIAGYLERDVSVGGLSLHFQEWGNPANPTILMVHGFGVSGHMFDEFAQRAQDRYHLVAIDQRGHGDSDWSAEGDYSRDAFVEDLEGFRKSLGLEDIILMGHSMGGLNAVAYVNRYPAQVKALVLVDVGPEAAKEGVDNIVRFTRGPDELDFDEFVEMAHRFNPRRSLENIRERMRHRLRQTEGGKWTWKFDKRFREQDGVLKVGSELSNDEMWQLFRSVHVPTLLVRGSESDVLTQEVAERVVSEMEKAKLALVPGAGHSVPGDNPDDFTEAVESFLTELREARFEPEARAAPPPLEKLVEENGQAARRPGVGTLVLVGVGAVLAIGGLAFMVNRSRKRRGTARSEAMARREALARRVQAAAPAIHLPRNVALVGAGERARAAAGHLSASGRRGAKVASRAASEVDWQAARENAAGWVGFVGDEARTVAARVDRKKLRKRKASAVKQATTAITRLAQVAAAVATYAGFRAHGRRRRPRIARWRS
jgi:pimeloyl-ACP methyl ester carboxylesterase